MKKTAHFVLGWAAAAINNRTSTRRPNASLLDEFSIAVVITTMRIEDVLKELRNEMTIILVTNLVQQARRLSDRTAFS